VLAVLVTLLALCPTGALAAPPVPRPAVVATHWIVMDADTGRVLESARPHDRTAMASLTKVMTALVALERGDLNQQVLIVESDLIGESSAGLEAGEQVTLRTLVYGLLLRSGNDAAMAIARAVGGSPQDDDPAARARFVGWMNDKAAELSLAGTRFANPHGLDEEGHYSTVYDLAVLTRAALDHPILVAVLGADRYEADGVVYRQSNRLPERYPGVVGGKTGWTDHAGLCLIEVAERAGHRLIVVLIGSTLEHWYDDAAKLLDYGWALLDPPVSDEATERLFRWWWARVDGPVEAGLVRRSWVWGAPLGALVHEPYASASGDWRRVQYFEKGRMEVTDPLTVVDARWRVTGGRLAWELITGQRQVGEGAFVTLRPARLPVAGDPGSSGPTYATLRPLLSAPAAPAGTPVTLRLDSDGQARADPSLERYQVTAGEPVPETGHGVASVFADFLKTRGPVLVNGWLREEPLFDPAFALLGLPITEPYWVTVPVGGQSRDVLVQCFERRCLTYTPDNPPGWRVEMGNIGVHYRQWLLADRIAGRCLSCRLIP
jgi:hypothetical protein